MAHALHVHWPPLPQLDPQPPQDGQFGVGLLGHEGVGQPGVGLGQIGVGLQMMMQQIIGQ